MQDHESYEEEKCGCKDHEIQNLRRENRGE